MKPAIASSTRAPGRPTVSAHSLRRTSKNIALLVTASSCVSVIATARAQSSVTLYGVLDTAVRRVQNENVGGLYTLSSVGNRTSRFGVRGLEDLGSGWTTGFKLEALVGTDTGSAGSTTQQGLFWSRGAYVEIGHKSYGMLRLGYDLNPTYVTWYENDPWLNIGMGSSGNLYDPSQNGPIRAAFGPVPKGEIPIVYTRNMVQYFTPNYGGFFGVFAAAPGEGSVTSTGADKQVLVRLGYVADTFNAAVSRARSDPQIAGAPGRVKFTDTAATAAYTIGPVKLAVVWREFRALAAKEKHYVLAATVNLPPGRILASYGKVDMSGTVTTQLAAGTRAGSVNANDASMWALSYVYNLSKRTALYTTGARISNHGGSFLVLPGGPPVNATNFSGRTSSGIDFGLWHSF